MAKWDHDDLRDRSGDRNAEAIADQRDVLAQGARAVRALKERASGVAPTPAYGRLIEGDSAWRKTFPMCEGLLDYFPDALAEVSRVSFLGNAKHNPGEPMHHARGKSMDHANCIARHLVERGGFDVVVIDGVEHKIRHSGSLAWRALALLQEEIERERGLSLPRGAKEG